MTNFYSIFIEFKDGSRKNFKFSVTNEEIYDKIYEIIEGKEFVYIFSNGIDVTEAFK